MFGDRIESIRLASELALGRAMNQLTWTFVVSASLMLVAGRTRAVEPLPARPLTAVTDVSDDFRQEVKLASRSIPDGVWRKVERSGWKVTIAEFVVDAAPSLKNQQPRGWPSSATWKHSDAVHLADAKLLILAEKRLNASGRIVSCNRVPGVLRHEFGHAFDFAQPGLYGSHSATPEYITAYHQDVAAMDPIQRRPLGYFLQEHRAGRQEAFAEAFAILLGGGTDIGPSERFATAFPRVLKHVKSVLHATENAAP